MKPTVDIVVPVYNASHLTWQFLTNAMLFSDARIIVVDDGSTDDTPNLERFITHNGHKYISHPTNRGPHAAWHTGLAASDADVTVVSNNDVVFGPGAVEAVAGCARRHGFGCLTQSERGEFRPSRLLVDGPNEDRPLPQRNCTAGNFFAIRRDVRDRVEVDYRMRLTHADIDFQERIRESGFGLYVNYSAFIHHYGSRTRHEVLGARADTEQSRKDFEVFKLKWIDKRPDLVAQHTPQSSVEQEIAWKVAQEAVR